MNRNKVRCISDAEFYLFGLFLEFLWGKISDNPDENDNQLLISINDSVFQLKFPQKQNAELAFAIVVKGEIKNFYDIDKIDWFSAIASGYDYLPL